MTDSNQLKLGWMAWESDQTNGYAHIAQQHRLHLEKHGTRFMNAYTGGWDAVVSVCTPTRWSVGQSLGPRPDLVYHTMFEGTPIPPGWVENLNCAGLVWVPSQYCMDLFRESGVTTPMFKAGYGVDHNAYQEVSRRGRKGTMKFIIWADSLISRKNVIKAVRAFVDAGLPEAELEIKLHSFAGMSHDSLFADKNGNPLANVTIHTGAWPRSRLVRWLQSADCGIYLSGGEGFGLMPLEAMATGLPMVVADNTGMREYLSPENAFLVPCPTTKLEATYSVGYGYQCSMAVPDHEAAVEAIRRVYKNREAAYEVGQLGAMEARKWTWEGESRKAYEAICAHYGRRP